MSWTIFEKDHTDSTFFSLADSNTNESLGANRAAKEKQKHKDNFWTQLFFGGRCHRRVGKHFFRKKNKWSLTLYNNPWKVYFVFFAFCHRRGGEEKENSLDLNLAEYRRGR